MKSCRKNNYKDISVIHGRKAKFFMNEYLNYGEYNPDMCEFNPRSAELEMELRELAKNVENPKMSFLQNLMKRILLLSSAQN